MFLVTMACANGLVALGLMLLLRAGLVSFGQALYFCLGAYAACGIGRFFGISDIFLQMLAGALTAGFFAFVLGFLLARYRGIFFGLLWQFFGAPVAFLTGASLALLAALLLSLQALEPSGPQDLLF